jgi:hypothetical protein
MQGIKANKWLVGGGIVFGLGKLPSIFSYSGPDNTLPKIARFCCKRMQSICIEEDIGASDTWGSLKGVYVGTNCVTVATGACF